MSHFEAMHAPLHSGNGGNVITDGAALKPLYDGDDVIDFIDHKLRRRIAIALIVYCVLFVAGLAVLVSRIF